MTAALVARGFMAAAALTAAYDVIYTDEKFNRISNRRLLVYLGLALAAYAAQLAAALAASRGGFGLSFPYPPWGFFPAAAAVAGLSSAAAVVLWRLGQWPAGDAKLYAVGSVWLSVADPGSPLLPWRLPLVFLMNIFIPAAVFVLARTAAWLWVYKLRHRAAFLREMGLRRLPVYLRETHAELKSQLKASLGRWLRETRADPAPALAGAADLLAMTAAGAVVTVWLGPRLGLGVPGPFLGMGACLAWDAVRRSVGSRASWALCAAGTAAAGWGLPAGSWAALAAGWAQWLFLASLMQAGMLAVTFFLGTGERIIVLVWGASLTLGLIGGPRALLRWLGLQEPAFLRLAGWWLGFGVLYVLVAAFFEQDVDRLPPEKIRPWLVLAGPTVELLRSEPGFFEQHFSRLYPDGLTGPQAEALRDFCVRRAVPYAAFRRTVPFAKWIFLGAAMTFLLRRDLLGALLAGRGG